MSLPIARVYQMADGFWRWEFKARNLVSGKAFRNEQIAINSLVNTLRRRCVRRDDYVLIRDPQDPSKTAGHSADKPDVYIWLEGFQWHWACPQRNEAATMPQSALSWRSALVSAECSLGLDRSQMNIHHNRKPPENSSQTVETVETTTDTGDQRNTAPEQSESVLDHGPVTRSLQVTDYQWELLMEAVHLLKAKTDKNVHAFEHVAKITLEGPSLKAVQAGHEAHLKAQEELAIMILTLDPEGEFAKGL